MKKVLLLSGGLDSLYLYYSKPFIKDYVYIDYGQPFKEKELSVLDKLKIEYKIPHIEEIFEDEQGFFWARNLKMLMAVRESYFGEDIAVYFGNTVDDSFTDNQNSFLQKCANVIDACYSGRFKVISPLSDMTKEEISVKLKPYFEKNKIKPFWCDNNVDKPCGTCHNCRDMKNAGLWGYWTND